MITSSLKLWTVLLRCCQQTQQENLMKFSLYIVSITNFTLEIFLCLILTPAKYSFFSTVCMGVGEGDLSHILLLRAS